MGGRTQGTDLGLGGSSPSRVAIRRIRELLPYLSSLLLQKWSTMRISKHNNNKKTKRKKDLNFLYQIIKDNKDTTLLHSFCICKSRE